jgi:hypothetical protein
VCGPNGDDADPNNNPKEAGNWGRERQIRAELVGWLCMDQEARKQVHWRGIQVYGADVTGPLDLSYVNIPFQLAFRHCRLKEAITLQSADVSQLDCRVTSLASGMLRMILEGHTVCDSPRTVNAENATRFCLDETWGKKYCQRTSA